MMKYGLLVFLLLNLLIGVIATSCVSSKPIGDIKIQKSKNFKRNIDRLLLEHPSFETSHSGLVVKDIHSGEAVYSFKEDHYFTPASNTKLLTFYTALNVLGDTIEGLKYRETEDSLIIWGTGDPSFLDDRFKRNDLISNMLRSSDKKLYLSLGNYQDKRFGSGWSWEDYRFAYQCDKSAFPIYGNVSKILKSNLEKLSIYPDYFDIRLIPSGESLSTTFLRNIDNNIIYYDNERVDSTKNITRYLPFRADERTIGRLLSDHLGRNIEVIHSRIGLQNSKSIKTIESDTLYKYLLHPSDNFIAEQLLLNCGSKLFDTLNTRKVINWANENLLSDLPQKFQWVDGSGLSRYNMTTPSNMVHLLGKIYAKVDQERLFFLLPTGGESGTIRRFYKSDPPFIHAKTGSLRNNHSLSGYLIGDSGKVYAFSFMNSNYLTSNNDLKEGMDKVLRILKVNL